jgi:putative DNA primase/helicase
MSSPIDEFRAVVEAAGLRPSEIVADGKIQRCPVEGKESGSDGSYILHLDTPPSGYFKNWKSGEESKWTSRADNTLSKSERQALRERIEADRQIREAEAVKRREEGAQKAQRILGEASDCKEHGYLTRKGVASCAGLKVDKDGTLLVPVYSPDDSQVMSLQRISPEPIPKRFMSGGSVGGGFFPIPTSREHNENWTQGPVYIAEGIATTLSVHEATGGEAVICAFSSGNLEAVARYVRSLNTTRQIIIAGDNDAKTQGNPGRKAAEKAARAVNGLVVIPEFTGDASGTDFNDLAAVSGLDAVKVQIAKAGIPPEEEAPKQSTGSGEGEASPQFQAALRALDEIGAGNVVHAKGSFWRWRESGVWQRVEDMWVKQVIQRGERENKRLSGQLVGSIMSLIQNEVYRPDHDFDRDPTTINVLNGELRWTCGAWELAPHKREDFRTTQIPVNYTPGATAPRFAQFLDEVFRDDPDRKDKENIVLEAMGYSLLSSCEFEKFILLIGNGANGKSVLMETLKALVGTNNTTAVQPSQFENKFQRAHLHGKLVNLVTEIAEGAQIADAQLKSIVSGETTTAEHKLKAPFEFNPICTCWFGTNHLPHTRDFSDALFRRAMVLTFNRTFTEAEQDKALKMKLREELPGIMNLALEAFSGVLIRGHFSTASSCENAKREWRIESDQIAQFVGDRCEKGTTFKETTDILYQHYKAWAEDAGIRRCVNKNNFTTRMEKLGAERHRTGRARYLVGFKLSSGSDTSDASDAVFEIESIKSNHVYSLNGCM